MDLSPPRPQFPWLILVSRLALFAIAQALIALVPRLFGVFVVIALPVYLLGKSMPETRGSLWAIATPFLGDVPIFAMNARRAT